MNMGQSLTGVPQPLARPLTLGDLADHPSDRHRSISSVSRGTASPAGAGYFGGGSQLGPGMVFGVIAGEHAARQARIEL